MKKDWTTIEVLSHSRHDWLNKIQIIKGHLSLHNYDRVKEIIDEIVIEAQSEAKLSQLHTPQFAALLLTCNWNDYSFRLDYELLDTHHTFVGELDDVHLTSWTSSFFECLQESIQPFADNHLSITIERDQTRTCFFFDFQGIIKQTAKLEEFLANGTSFMSMHIQELTEEQFSLEVIYNECLQER